MGRFGNNLIQISSGLMNAEKNNSNLYFPYHSMLNDSKIILNENNKDDCFEDLFWGISFDENIRRRLCKKYLNKLIIFQEEKLNDNDLVIHLRGGDIFQLNPPKNYVQAPFSFIKEVIEITKPKTIYVVYEDETNPNVSMISNTYENVVFVNDLQIGINLILSTKKLVITGVTTFSRMLAMCSLNIETIYQPSFIRTDDYILNNDDDIDCGNNYITIKFCDYNDIENIILPIKNDIKYPQWYWNNDMYSKLISL